MKKLHDYAVKSIAALTASVMLAATAHAGEKMVVAADVGFAPHVMAKPGGGVEGYNVDLMEEIGRRLGVEFEIVDQEWSGIFAGLNAKKYDFIIAPTTVTPERAKKMLFMEGYLDSEIVFLIKNDSPDIASEAGLKGKTIAVNKGNIYDKWLTEREDKLNLTIQRYGKNADAILAVQSGRADAYIASGSASGWAAKQNPMLKTSLVVRTGRYFSAPFRLEDVELRNRIERVVECMKLDGFFSKLHEKWFASPAGAGSTMVTVEAGYGAPGIPGHEPTFHRPDCG
ncbi:MAG: transporter substrate-binding domain-containing protein [Pseudomonadota bacterium]|jgi:polar amino acid transport system substrate-binding protein|nr:transporter substrate-binding domain-containing protein [Pseudomonadota bacterium]